MCGKANMQVKEIQFGTPERGAETPLSHKVIRNAIFGGLRYALVAPIPFVMTPLILHKIGVGGYGTWAVFLAINGITSLADLGLVGTLSKFVAEYHAQQDPSAVSRVVNSGLTLFLILATVIGTLLWTGAPLLASWLFRGTTSSRIDVVSLLRLFVVVVMANVLILMLASVTTGLQRLDITNMISAANSFLSALFSAILLLHGDGLRGLVYGYIVSSVITVGAYLITVRRLLPGVAMNPLLFNRHEAGKMFGFSFRLYVTQAAVVVHNQIEKLFLAMLVGVAAAGWYDIASDVAIKLRGAIGFLLTPVLPAASELSALKDSQRIEKLYFRTHKYLALVGIPAICYVTAISSRFVDLWIGPEMKMVVVPLCVLLAVSLINLATGPGFLIYAGGGNLKPGVDAALLGIIVNVLFSFILIYRYGFAGAVVGTSASLITAATYFVIVFHRQTKYSFSRLLLECYVKPCLCAVISAALVFAVFPRKDLSWLGLAILALGFAAIYSLLILLSQFFDSYDWNKMEAFVPVMRHVRRLARTA